MGDGYLWVKVVHILAVISWMAGLFYLPRLFVYHAERGGSDDLSRVFVVMERRLLKAIMRPAAAVALVTGAWLVHDGGFDGPVPGWLWFKLSGVIALLIFHGRLEWHAAQMSAGKNSYSGRYFRIINEIPTVLLVGIVIFVVVKPWI